MSFQMKHPVRNDYLPINTKRRSGARLVKVRFVVDHDTGNPNSTAQGNVNYYKNSANAMSASAHVFIDDKDIIICVPLWEKAWHVLYNVTTDNRLYGVDANDAAIGVELCYFPNDKARSLKAYEKYVWYNAWLAYTYKLNIDKDFVGHSKLDPGRKTDPENAFRHIGKTFNSFLADVKREYNDCVKANVKPATPNPSVTGSITDYLISLGMDSSFSARAKLAIQYGISGYAGTATQNTLLLDRMRSNWKPAAPKPDPVKPVSKPKPQPPIKEESKEELEKLELAKWQREELRDIFKDARTKGIFKSDAHEKTIMDGTMTMSYLIYLQSVIASAALNGGKRTSK